MGEVLTTFDLIVFVVSLAVVMAVGLYAGRREENTEDYFLAGRKIRWFGVAASIFGSNVSANHLVGFVGAGFAIGFAQSHFELGAIAGLMLLCYGFLPVYRRLGLYTLSQYLSQRYDERSRLVYVIIMLLVMVVVQMVGGFYIGARSLGLLLDGSPLELSYNAGVIALAVIAATYTIQGGLKAVVWTDVIQSCLLLAAGVLIAVVTFWQPEVGGWGGMMRLDTGGGMLDKMRLYRPAADPDLPWTGVLSGLMALHFFYWGTNQFIVQRALGAVSDAEARRGIVAAGMLKLLIPFFSIAAGVAAYYLLAERFPGHSIDQDTVFTELTKMLVAPLAPGLVGLVAAGLIGAILSSIDSMMNSSATIVTIDIYQRYINPRADERRLIWVGRLSIVVFVVLAAALAIATQDPQSDENFFLNIVDQQSHLVPGLLVAFLCGMFWSRATSSGAFAAIVAGPVFSFVLAWSYAPLSRSMPQLSAWFGPQLNTFHRVAVVVLFSMVVLIVTSLVTPHDPEKGRLTWVHLSGVRRGAGRRLFWQLAVSLVFYVGLAVLMVQAIVTPTAAAVIAAAWTFGAFFFAALDRRRMRDVPADDPPSPQKAPHAETATVPLYFDDRVWAGVLCAGAMFMMYYFY